jgi:hypothetical protein
MIGSLTDSSTLDLKNMSELTLNQVKADISQKLSD